VTVRIRADSVSAGDLSGHERETCECTERSGAARIEPVGDHNAGSLVWGRESRGARES
jgi:hypothetical protein